MRTLAVTVWLLAALGQGTAGPQHKGVISTATEGSSEHPSSAGPHLPQVTVRSAF